MGSSARRTPTPARSAQRRHHPPPCQQGPSAWEDATRQWGNSVYQKTRLHSTNQARELAHISAMCRPDGSAALQVQTGFAFTHINWAEVERDENLTVYYWWRGSREEGKRY